MTVTEINPQGGPPEEEEGPARRRAWRTWFKKEPTYEEVTAGTEVARRAQELESDWDAKLAEERDAVTAWVEKHALKLPDSRYVKRRAKVLARHLPGIVVKLVVVKIPALVWNEVIGPVWIGSGKCIVAYHSWVTAARLDDAHQIAEGALKARQKADQHKAHGHRVYASLTAGLLLAGSGAYLFYVHRLAFWVIVIVLVGIIDLIGRAGRVKKDLAPAHREMLHENISFAQLTASIQAAFNETVGVDTNGVGLVRCDGVCSYDFDRQEWRQYLTHWQKIKPEDVDYVQRAIGAPPNTVKLLEVPSAAMRRILVIKHGDALKNVPQAPDGPAGSLSIMVPADLGVSKNIDQPFRIFIAGVHVIIVAKTGGGKTVHFDNLIDYVSKCRNAVAWGINLAKRHAFSKWRGVVQKVARTPEEAEALLDAALAEIQRRMDILDELANSDDPSKHTDSWNPDDPDMGPALVIFIDEFPQLAEFNGKPSGTLDLLTKVEKVHRIGREVMVSIVLALQKWGNKDSGSTIVSSQSTVVIVGPCAPYDAGEVFGYDKRDAGWSPHLLKPANEDAINDAGKAFVLGPGFLEPDEVRGWAPRGMTDTIALANRRVQEGLPKLVTVDGEDDIEEAAIVPNMLAALQAAFDYFEPSDGWLPSTMAAKWISEQSGEKVTTHRLSADLKKELGSRMEDGLIPQPRPTRNELGGNCNCYARADVEAAMGAL